MKTDIIRPDFEALPLFDMREFNDRSDERRRIFVNRLRDACHNVGFFYITDFGVTPESIEHILKLTEAFFSLSQVEKDSLGISLSPHYRGYGRLQEEVTLGVPDYKETYDLGWERPVKDLSLVSPYWILQGPNQWPDSSFLDKLKWKQAVLKYMTSMQKVGEQLMMALSLALGFPTEHFAKEFSRGSNESYAILRLLKYPPGIGSQNGEPRYGVGPHIDSGCLVLLLQDSIGGLEVQNCSGKWVAAPPRAGSVIVNIGKMLEVWSNNYFVATPHRVVNRSTRIRYSLPFFLEPNLDTVVTPLELPSALLSGMKRPTMDPTTRIIYGEHMFQVYRRSFPKNV